MQQNRLQYFQQLKIPLAEYLLLITQPAEIKLKRQLVVIIKNFNHGAVTMRLLPSQIKRPVVTAILFETLHIAHCTDWQWLSWVTILGIRYNQSLRGNIQ